MGEPEFDSDSKNMGNILDYRIIFDNIKKDWSRRSTNPFR